MRTPLALLAILALCAPTAAATGYLVNVGIGTYSLTFGQNAFGGSGDTLDVGIANEQCSDEADVVDVGVANTEGGSACHEGERCTHNEGSDPVLAPLLAAILTPGGEPVPASCGDDGDAIDVGILNSEGSSSYECNEKGCNATYAGDAGDATDVGIANCESGDTNDGTDVGVINNEWDDRSDTFDLSILNNEWPEGGDTNGIGLAGSSSTGVHLDCVRLKFPIGPAGPLLGVLP